MNLHALILLVAVASPAFGQTYSNPQSQGVFYAINVFGSSGNYGETFSLKEQKVLNSWSFLTYGGFSGNVSFNISPWTTSRFESIIYSLDSYKSAGSDGAITFDNLNLTLAPGKYTAFITGVGVPNAFGTSALRVSDSDGGLGGSMVSFFPGGTDTSIYNVWGITENLNWKFIATFNAVSAVPEPTSTIMLLVGMGVMGVFARRKLHQTSPSISA